MKIKNITGPISVTEAPAPSTRKEAIDYFEELFGTRKPIIVEIGCGNGHFLVEYAKTHPDYNFIGVEKLSGRAKKCIRKIKNQSLINVAVFRGDAKIFLWEYIYTEMVSEFIILFPDPWPKKRHHKHRLLKKEVIEMLEERLIKGGTISVATDNPDFYRWLILEFEKVKRLEPILINVKGYPTEYPPTLFLERHIREGKEIYFLRFKKF